MKNIFIAIILVLFVNKIYAGYTDSSYYDNQLYVMLTESAARSIIDERGNVQLSFFYKQFASLLQDRQIISATTPFFKANSTPLQRIVQLTFEKPDNLDIISNIFSEHLSAVYAEKVPILYIHNAYEPNDLKQNSLSGQWYLHKIQAPQAWHFGKGTSNVKIAVVDDAVNIDHHDLSSILWTNPGEIPENGIDDDGNGYIDDVHGYDVADDDSDPNPYTPQQTHGTHVSGIACAATDNDTGIASIGFGVSLIGVKVAPDGSSGIPYAMSGVVYAVVAGADIINCSWGTANYSTSHKQVIDYALENGAIVVSAPPNMGSKAASYPAAYPGVLSVGGTSMSDRMSSYSNYGNWLSICAPGDRILSTYPNDQFSIRSGTSMASPLVAGLLGLMKSHYPEVSNEDLKQCLFSTADSIEHLNSAKYKGKTGAGRINAYRAMKCIDDLKNGITYIRKASDKNGELLIYPNPARREVTIYYPESSSAGISIVITDLSGRVVRREKYEEFQSGRDTSLSIGLQGITPGIYFIELFSGINNRRVANLVVQ